MSLSSKGMFVVAVSLGAIFAAQASAQETSKDLESVLVGDDDLRPLIDLGTPPATESRAVESKPRTIAIQPVPELNPRTSAEVADHVSGEPISLIPGLLPIADRPAGNVPKPAAKNSNPAAQAQPSVLTTIDPTFDLGISAVDTSTGQRVRGVFVNSPAQRAGIKPNDIITSIAGKSIKTANELANSLLVNLRGNSFPLTVTRGGQSLAIQVNAMAGQSSVVSNAPNQLRQRPRRRVPVTTVSAQPNVEGQSIEVPQPVTTPNRFRAPISQAIPQQIRREIRLAQPVPIQNRNRVVQAPTRQRPAQARNNRPLIGDGGRLIGNGRIMNSALRIIGR